MAAEFSLFPTALGDCGIAWRDGKVVATHLPENTPHQTATRLAERSGASAGAPPRFVQAAIEAITALLTGADLDLADIECDFARVEPFAVSVYGIARTIPVGQTLTYGGVALALGDKLLAQRVGQALGRNPLPIIVPCHRVIGANGQLTGFSAHGGVDTKMKMLAIEGAIPGEQLGLFDD